ncbi:MAG: exodeoxyribonuclease VII large subunit [Acidocella sp.]|nr:exodeoxyribonuclease VII large subunit [Acidocella sp.]
MSDLMQNAPEFTVSELAGTVKKTLETAFGRVRVRGEITEFKAYGSGHQYFALKDDGAKIRAIIWKAVVGRVGLKAENGIEVIATGRLTSYPERSEYQLIVEKLEYAGVGALLAKIEALRVRLAAEGLFTRKQALPMVPRFIGVVTSPQGAVLQDIKTTIARRFPCEIILWPVSVQGEAAAGQIAAAINGFSALPRSGPIPRPDVLIVARGGGSLEDLMAFNDEAVVRAAALCTIPLISAVGHETDTTLIDFASDRRAPTPTAAAEMAIPARLELIADLSQKSARLSGALSRRSGEARSSLDRASGKLPDLATLLGIARQRFDDRSERLTMALPNFVDARRRRLDEASIRLYHPREVIAGKTSVLALLGQRFSTGWSNVARRAEARVEAIAVQLPDPHVQMLRHQNRVMLLGQRLQTTIPGKLTESAIFVRALSARLEAVSYAAVLLRGFALVTNSKSVAVTSVSEATPGAALNIRFADGAVPVKVAPTQGKLPL